jgi:hypothetical protein
LNLVASVVLVVCAAGWVYHQVSVSRQEVDAYSLSQTARSLAREGSALQKGPGPWQASSLAQAAKDVPDGVKVQTGAGFQVPLAKASDADLVASAFRVELSGDRAAACMTLQASRPDVTVEPTACPR